MNTSNVMSVSNSAGSQGRTARGAEIKGRTGSGRGKGAAFDDVLAQSKGQEGSLTPKDIKDLADSAKAADKESNALEKAAEGTVDVKDAGTASKDTGKQASEVASGEEKGPEWSAGSVAAVNPLQMGALQTETGSMTGESEEPEIAVSTVEVDVEDIPMDWLSQGRQEAEPKSNLHSLLPPSEEQAAKSKQMLAMLSGQMVKEAGQDERPVMPSVQLQDAKTPSDTFGQDPSAQRFQSVDTAFRGGMQSLKDPLSAQSLQMARNLSTEGQVGLSMEPLPQENMIGQQMAEEVLGVAQPVEEPAMSALAADRSTGVSQPKQSQPVVQGENILGGVQAEVEDIPVNPARDLQFAQQQDQRYPQQQSQQQMPFQRGSAEGNIMFPEAPLGNDEGQAFSTEGAVQNAPAFQQTLQHAGGTGQSAPASQIRDDFNVTQQIVEQARLIRSQESTEMVIRLKPEHLGELTLRVSVSSEGAVTASFFSDNAQVRHIVESSLVQLRQELENQGIKVDKAEVYAGLSDGQLPQEQGQQAWQQQGQGNPSAPLRSLNADMESFEETATELSATESVSGDSVEEGVNYLV